MKNATRRGEGKRRFLFALYLILVLAGVDYLCYLRYVSRLRGRRSPHSGQTLISESRKFGVSPGLLNSLGKFSRLRPGRYSDFSMEPKPGVIRIGAFGSSFVSGAETAAGLDYPSILEHIFRAHGYRNVEVINFGNSAWGFDQAFYFWKHFGRRYGLDFLLLGPEVFHPDWDCTFCQWDMSAPYYLHGRYILRKGRPVFLDILGGRSFSDRFGQYYRFIPRWRYLRYDANPPSFLRCLLPAGRSLRNPFYYRREGALKTEQEAIYERLLSQMVSATPQTILLDLPWNKIKYARMESSIQGNFVQSAVHFPIFEFPHYRHYHLSGNGNYLVARQFFDVLTNRKRVETPILKFSLPVISRRSAARPVVSLDSFSGVSLEMAGRPSGYFFELTADSATSGDAPLDFQRKKIQSLLALRGLVGSGGSPLDWVYEPVGFRLRPGMKAALIVWSPFGRRVVNLGRLCWINPEVPIGYLSLPAHVDFENWPTLAADPDWLKSLRIHFRFWSKGVLEIDGHPVYEMAEEDGAVVFKPLHEGLVIKPSSSTLFSEEHLPLAGVVYLSLKNSSRGMRVPFARWSKQDKFFYYDRGGLKYYIAHRPHRGRGAAVMVRRP